MRKKYESLVFLMEDKEYKSLDVHNDIISNIFMDDWNIGSDEITKFWVKEIP